MNTVKLQQLRFFVAAYEERSISGAARKVNATQSGVSVQLRDLEDHLKLVLFERVSTGIVPTKAGDAIYRRSVKILREVGQLSEDVALHSGALGGRVRVGIMPTFARAVLAPVLEAFQTENPLVDVKVIEGYSGMLTEMVLAGDLDFAIVPDGKLPAGLRTTFIDTDLELLASRKPLADADGPVSLANIGALRLVLPGPSNTRRAKIDQHLEIHSDVAHSILELDSMMTTLDIVSRGDFCAILPGCLCLPDFNNPDIRLYPIHEPNLTVDYLLIEPAKTSAPAAVKLFADHLTAEIRRQCDVCRAHFGFANAPR